eukprot:5751115-Alexandrium_andersonii.AAC.1
MCIRDRSGPALGSARPELAGVIMSMMCDEPIHVMCDNKSVVLRMQTLLHAMQNGRACNVANWPNNDLWSSVAKALAARGPHS